MDAETLKAFGNLGATAFLGGGVLWLLIKTIPEIMRTHATAIGEVVKASREDQSLERIARKEDREAIVSALERNTQSNNALAVKIDGLSKR